MVGLEYPYKVCGSGGTGDRFPTTPRGDLLRPIPGFGDAALPIGAWIGAGLYMVIVSMDNQ